MNTSSDTALSGLHDALIQRLDLRRTDVNQMSDQELWRYAEGHLRLLLDQNPRLDLTQRTSIERQLLQEVVGLGLVDDLLKDDDITEIMINGPKDVFIERRGCLHRVVQRFSSQQALMGVIERLLQQTGRRVNVVVPPLSLIGPVVTIRKFGRQRLSMDDLVQHGTLSAGMADFLRIAVKYRRNIVVSGGTGTGKTTLLNCLSELIPSSERLITIEDSAELRLCHENLVVLEARPRNAEGAGTVSIRDLVRNALRMRPDRIVVGECRGGEALDMLQAMNTGHDGSLTTAHANSPRDVLSRLEVMTMMAGMELPLLAIREQIASAVDLVVHLGRFGCGSRCIAAIVEITGIESGRIQTQELFRFHRTGSDSRGKVIGHFMATGNEPCFFEQLAPTERPAALAPGSAC
jgi:pilus assembly protein CpaF